MSVRRQILYNVLISCLLFIGGIVAAVFVSYLNTLKIPQIKYLSGCAIYGITGAVLYLRKTKLADRILFFLPIAIILIFFGIIFNNIDIFTKLQSAMELILLFICYNTARWLDRQSVKGRVLLSLLFLCGICMFVFIGVPYMHYKTLTLYENNIPSKKVRQITLIDRDNKSITFDSIYLNQKTIFIDFWYKRCPPCLTKMQPLSDVVAHFKGDTSIVFLIVNAGNIDSYEQFTDAINNIPYHFTFMYDKDGLLIRELNVSGYPTEVILHKGKIVHSLIGYDRGSANYFYQKNLIALLSQFSTKN